MKKDTHELNIELLPEMMDKIKRVLAPYGMANSLNAILQLLFNMIDNFIENKVQIYTHIANLCIDEIKEINQGIKNEDNRSNDKVKDSKRGRKAKKQVSQDITE